MRLSITLSTLGLVLAALSACGDLQEDASAISAEPPSEFRTCSPYPFGENCSQGNSPWIGSYTIGNMKESFNSAATNEGNTVTITGGTIWHANAERTVESISVSSYQVLTVYYTSGATRVSVTGTAVVGLTLDLVIDPTVGSNVPAKLKILSADCWSDSYLGTTLCGYQNGTDIVPDDTDVFPKLTTGGDDYYAVCPLDDNDGTLNSWWKFASTFNDRVHLDTLADPTELLYGGSTAFSMTCASGSVSKILLNEQTTANWSPGKTSHGTASEAEAEAMLRGINAVHEGVSTTVMGSFYCMVDLTGTPLFGGTCSDLEQLGGLFEAGYNNDGTVCTNSTGNSGDGVHRHSVDPNTEFDWDSVPVCTTQSSAIANGATVGIWTLPYSP